MRYTNLKTYEEIKQELDVVRAGVLMLAQIVKVDIPDDYKSQDLISEVAGWIEDLQNENHELKDLLLVLKEAQAEIKSIIEQPEG